MEINFQGFKDTILPVYRDYLEPMEDIRKLVLYGGAGSGKSRFVVQRMCYKLLKSKRKLLVIRKVNATVTQSTWAEFKGQLEAMGIYKYCSTNKTEKTMLLPNGSEILFKGLDDSEKIKSISGITDIWIEEATELIKEDYLQLDLRMRTKAKHQEIVLTFNPVSKGNWVYKYFFENGCPNDVKILKTTYKDNPHLPKAYIKTIENLKHTDPIQYDIYANGKFATLGQRIFNNWEVKEFDIKEVEQYNYKKFASDNNFDIENITSPKNHPIYKKYFNRTYNYSVDWGFSNDPTAIISTLVDLKSKEIWIFNEYFAKGLLNSDIYKVFEDLGITREVITADSASPKDIEDLRRMGVTRIKPCIKGNDSVLNGIKFLSEFKIYISPKCHNIIEEFENYQWKKDKNGVYTEKPVDLFNHGIDALRYQITALKKANNTIRTMSRTALF